MTINSFHMYIIACNCSTSSHHFVQNLGIVKCFNAYLYFTLFLSISYLLFSVRFLNIFIMLISCLSFYEFFSKFSLLCRKQILRFSDPQPQSVLSWKCYLSFIIYKWNEIKRKIIDDIHAFYKVIANLPIMDIME